MPEDGTIFRAARALQKALNLSGARRRATPEAAATIRACSAIIRGSPPRLLSR